MNRLEAEMAKVGVWKAAIWDRPMNGTRWCVERKNAAIYGGVEVRGDERNSLITYASRAEAMRAATRANKATP